MITRIRHLPRNSNLSRLSSIWNPRRPVTSTSLLQGTTRRGLFVHSSPSIIYSQVPLYISDGYRNRLKNDRYNNTSCLHSLRYFSSTNDDNERIDSNNSTKASITTPDAPPTIIINDDDDDDDDDSVDELSSSFNTLFPPPKPSTQSLHLQRVRLKKDAVAKARTTANELQQQQQQQQQLSSSSDLHERWIAAERNLINSYDRAIRYISRTHRLPNAAKDAEGYLEEWLDRLGVPGTRHAMTDIDSLCHEESSKKQSPRKKRSSTQKSLLSMLSTPPPSNIPPLRHHPFLPLPSRRIYHDVLHAYANSKARKKGLRAEALLLRMSEVSWWYGRGKEEEEGVDGKAMALVVKCHAGSTHSHSLKQLSSLVETNNLYAEQQSNNVNNIKNDPFILLHALKGIKNFNKPQHKTLAMDYFHRLHSFVTNDDKASTYFSAHRNQNDDNHNHHDRLDLTAVYNHVLRELVKSPTTTTTTTTSYEAQSLLDAMYAIRTNPTKKYCKMTIRTSAYDAVLRAYRDDAKRMTKKRIKSIKVKEPKKRRISLMENLTLVSSSPSTAVDNAFQLLNKMIDASQARRMIGDDDDDDERDDYIPDPSETSFEITMQSLAYYGSTTTNDSNLILKRLEHILDSWNQFLISNNNNNNNNNRSSSPRVPNAAIELYTTILPPTLLLPRTLQILDNLKSHPHLSPDGTTYALLLKSCAIVSRRSTNAMAEKEMARRTAEETYEMLCRDENADRLLTSGCFHYWMDCIRYSTTDDDDDDDDDIVIDDHDNDENDNDDDKTTTTQLTTKNKTKILHAFNNCCERGLLDLNVLNTFRSCVTPKEFETVVGKGRLSDLWVRNVTERRVAYTDGSKSKKTREGKRPKMKKMKRRAGGGGRKRD